jgi:hypothetical protein
MQARPLATLPLRPLAIAALMLNEPFYFHPPDFIISRAVYFA